MFLPELQIEKLIFQPQLDFNALELKLDLVKHLNKDGDFTNINWLNTPGPIYTTFTDNCGTGQVEAIDNVSGDEDYHEVIFKQPFNEKELDETLSAALCDPFGSYYFDGNLNWNADSVLNWWNRSEERASYIMARYKDELELPEQPHISHWKIGDKVFAGQLFGPPRPMPENYKTWLDFYQFGLKQYLEWYIQKLQNLQISLPIFKYDWKYKLELDKLYKLNFPKKV
ncbi:hypothetical protein SAMN05216524_106429 [Mucilaginibacter sp. OK098]|nr:hypothetical protein SAMN05216524_106429 [Mucilaginibacter sp. OK098]